MDFNFDTGAIYGGLQSLDVSTLPPLGGQAGVLTLVGTGAITLLGGITGDRPATPVAGMFRYNSSNTALEYYDSTTWIQLSVGGGTVTSVGAASSTAALTIANSPITSSGSFTFDLDADLTAIAALTGTGLSVRTAADTWALTSIQGTAGNITVANGNAVAGDPTINLAAITQGTSTNFVKVTLDGFGRVTGNSAVTTSDITTLVDGTYVNVSGDTMSSGANLTFVGGGEVLGLPVTPSGDTAATSKAYVDNIAAGLSWKQAVMVATTAGDGNINLATGGLLTLDTNYTVTAGQRVLVKNQTNAAQNGIYIASAGAWIRSTDMDSITPVNEINGAAVYVENGASQADTGWTQINTVAVLGTDPIVWAQFSGGGTYTAGNGLTLAGTVFSLSSPVSVANGGTALTSAPANGQLLIGNGSGYTLATLTDGTAISITEAAGAITITNTGVTSLAGTANQISASASTGAVTLSVPSAFIAPGSVQITTSLTVDTLTPNSALYVGAAGLVSSTAALTDGQILIGDTGSAPVAATITGGTGVTVTNGAGSITIDIDNTEVVTSFSAGTTGLTPNSATTGAVTLAGTLAVANGGTGLTALGTSNQVFGVDAAGTAAEYKTLTAGTGMSIVHGANVVTFNNTGVTSVGLTAPSIFTVSGSPVTTTGTLDFALNTQTANTIFAGPSSGGAAVPTFRALTAADLGTALQLYKENPVTPTAPSATGTNAVAIGSSSTATAEDGFAVGDGTDARIVGMKAFANGQFSTTPGSAQHGIYVLRNETTDNTLTELFINGTSEKIVMPNNSVFTFDILVAARRTDATGGGAAYRFVGVARKDATAGSITFIGTPSKTVIGETNAAWDAAVSVDTVNGAFRVRVTGENAKTIRWVATVTTTEVTN
jgi:hypothetical protein